MPERHGRSARPRRSRALRKYRDIGITKFILSDTPYLREIERQDRTLLPLLGSVSDDVSLTIEKSHE